MLISTEEILSKSWNLYKKNWKNLSNYMLLIFLPTVILFILDTANTYLYSIFGPSKTAIGALALFFGLVAIGLVFMLWAAIALSRALLKLVEDQPLPHWKETFSQSNNLIWPVVYTSLLAGIIILGGTFLLIVPGIIFSVWYSFVFYIVALEGKTGMSALRESKAMVAGRWWGILWRLLAPAVVIGLGSSLIALILSAPFGLLVKDEFTREISTSIISSAINAIFTPLSALAAIALYASAKANPVSNLPEQTTPQV
ncbi:hypothetical protein EPN28_02485 [Patescibacteria group bacterium]|nr:MAG: hypothetical protein EPN28_02485 [Patescibacteria group bacterium]